VRERLQGARLAVAAHPDATLDVVWSARTTAGVGRILGAGIAAAPPESRPDGILAANDHLACGVVFGLISNGVRVPEEIAVIGYDDIEFASVAAVPLTSVRQPAREMGRHAGELLIDQLEGGSSEPLGSVMFQPELVVRASSVPGA
jgi:LacI family transcriptional regulator